MPGHFVSFDAGTCTAVVQIGIAGQQTSDGVSTAVPYPVLVDVPVQFPRGGGAALTFPIAEGDECTVHIVDRAIDGWFESSGIQPPSSKRRQAISDAFAVPGSLSKPARLQNISTSTAQLRSVDGKTYVDLDPTGQVVKITAPGGLVIDAPSVKCSGTVTASGEITGNGIPLSTHTHSGVQSGSSSTGKPQG
ncbi:Gp138 family membrane-puncturing spike protein [Frateuria aurantia]|nr:Gp138 family membrane-puncturing spike protein [Frateuria aurantia]